MLHQFVILKLVNRLRNNNLGFGAIEALLAILIVVIIGFGGYYVYHSQKSSNVSPPVKTTQNTEKSAQNTPVKAPATNPDVLVISEWGIKLDFQGADKVDYKLQSQQDGSSAAVLSLKDTVTAIADCQDLQVALLREGTGPASNSVHYVNGYYYHVAGDPSPCSDPNGENGSVNQERVNVISALNNLSIEANK